MIYFQTTDHKHVLVLEPTNLQRVQEGKIIVSPDSLVIVCYSPDILWTSEKIRKVFEEDEGKLTPEKFEVILTQGLLRPRQERNDSDANANQVIPLGKP